MDDSIEEVEGKDPVNEDESSVIYLEILAEEAEWQRMGRKIMLWECGKKRPVWKPFHMKDVAWNRGKGKALLVGLMSRVGLLAVQNL